MEDNKLEDLAWKIMMKNPQYAELDRIYAINGNLSDQWFNRLSDIDQDDVMDSLAIGIASFNANIREQIEQARDWRRLPKIEVSGNDKS